MPSAQVIDVSSMMIGAIVVFAKIGILNRCRKYAWIEYGYDARIS